MWLVFFFLGFLNLEDEAICSFHTFRTSQWHSDTSQKTWILEDLSTEYRENISENWNLSQCRHWNVELHQEYTTQHKLLPSTQVHNTPIFTKQITQKFVSWKQKVVHFNSNFSLKNSLSPSLHLLYGATSLMNKNSGLHHRYDPYNSKHYKEQQ